MRWRFMILSMAAVRITAGWADDAVGVAAVAASASETAVFSMPFEPLAAGPGGCLAGPFAAADGEADELVWFRPDGSSTGAVMTARGWTDCAGSPPPPLAFGDAVALRGIGDEEFGFFVFGRVPELPALEATLWPGLNLASCGYPSVTPPEALPSGAEALGEGGSDWRFPLWVTNRLASALVWTRSRPYPALSSGLPRVVSMSAAPDGSALDLELSPGPPCDVFVLSAPSGGGFSLAGGWSRLGRLAAGTERWRDDGLAARLAAGGVAFYLVASAAADADGDTLSDMSERLVHGTDPLSADSDGDGSPDALEITGGTDPAAPGPVGWTEDFELPQVAIGPLDGQRGWSADDAAEVTASAAHSGAAGLALAGAAAARPLGGVASGVFWTDARLRLSPRPDGFAADEPGAVAVSLDRFGHPIAVDGAAVVTNTAVTLAEGAWTRLTCRVDPVGGTWDCYLGGVIVFADLALRGALEGTVELAGGDGAADDIVVTSTRPAGLSSDGDRLPDEWELAVFGDLGRDGTLDADGDGMSDFDEWRLGTDPWTPDGGGEPQSGDDDGGQTVWEERFEPPEMLCGALNGQCGWSAGGRATVTGEGAFAGAASLVLEKGGDEPVFAAHAADFGGGEMWIDMRVRLEWRVEALAADEPGALALALDSRGHPVAVDGGSLVTNALVEVSGGGWTRLTCRVDPVGGTWDCYLDGVIVFADLALRGTLEGTVELADGDGAADDIVVTSARPAGLSSDGDRLPDEWELAVFGDLSRDGTLDADGDWLSDFEEWRLGTDPLSADTDSDALPDGWEALRGLDPLDAGDASADPDGDSLSNLAEYALGTDPLSADTDSDGIPDDWERAHGLNPLLHDDALADPDGDTLSNLEEYLCGSDPHSPDTDADGCDDSTEVRNVRSDPLVADIEWCPTLIGGWAAASGQRSSTGTWRTDDDGIVYAVERSGSLSWDLEVPVGGADALAVEVAQYEQMSSGRDFDLSLFVDGLFVARQVVTAPYGECACAYFFLPETSPGTHDFRIVWRNWEENTFLSVRKLGFVRFGGPDRDDDGVVDWLEHRTSNASGIDGLPCGSLVSPVCVEGHDLWRDTLEVEVAYPETNAVYSVVKTIADGFYVDIPLVEDGVAEISLAGRAPGSGFAVAWDEFEIVSGAYATNALVIRAGDALRLAGHASGEDRISVCRADGGSWRSVTNWTQEAATAYVFETPGTYLVEAEPIGEDGEASVGFARVDVVSSRFSNRYPAIMVDMETTLPCPELAPRNLIEHDADLVVAAVTNAAGDISLTLSTSADRGLGLVSRIEEGGAISDAVQVTPVWADNGTYYHVTQTYPDGSQLVEISLLLGAITPDLTVRLQIFVSGVVFEDGTDEMTLTADDFDDNGHCTVRFVRSRGVTTSVCHRTYIYQGGKLVYNN